MFVSPRLLLIGWLVTRAVVGAVRVELNDGEIVTVDDEKSITPTVDPQPGDPIFGGISPRALFGRQYCSRPGQNIICANGCCPNDNYCCENTSCLDPTTRVCCQGGTQCSKGGDCCRDGNCCAPGKYCVRDLDTGEVGCLPYGGSTRTSADASTTRTSTRTAPPSPSFTCDDAGYRPCPDQRFCCPSGSYCYYNTDNAPRCYRSSYYTFYYSYSWSFSYGIRWYTTITTYYLNDNSGPTVLALTTPPAPTTPPPEASETVPPPSGAADGPTPTASGGPANTEEPGSVLPAGGEDDDDDARRSSSSRRTSSSTTARRTSPTAAAATDGIGGTSGASELQLVAAGGWMSWAAWMCPFVIGGIFPLVI